MELETIFCIFCVRLMCTNRDINLIDLYVSPYDRKPDCGSTFLQLEKETERFVTVSSSHGPLLHSHGPVCGSALSSENTNKFCL